MSIKPEPIEQRIISERYSRQVRFAPIGLEGQRQLAQSHIVLVGCGALGVHLADILARAGVGRLRLIDADRVELSNLQRQTLFDTHDAQAGRDKVAAAAERLLAINPDCQIDACPKRVTPANVEALIEGADLVLDAVDNFQTRLLINQACVKHRRPWIHGGCLGAIGNGMVILPGGRPCLTCIVPDPPRQTVTCNDVGIIAPAVATIGAWQATQALKYLTGHRDDLDLKYYRFDLWANTTQRLTLSASLMADCPVCGHGEFDLLPG